MPYRLRLFSDGRLLIATDHETTEEVGRQQASSFSFDAFDEPPGRRELVYRDEAGQERPASREEEDEVFEAAAQRSLELVEEGRPACARCGRRADEHEQLFPIRGTPDGPVYFDCWTPEERETLPPGFDG